jgi:hypothetical protein
MSNRDITTAQYDEIIADFEPNEYGQADLAEGLTVTGIFCSDRIRRLSASFGPLVQ